MVLGWALRKEKDWQRILMGRPVILDTCRLCSLFGVGYIYYLRLVLAFSFNGLLFKEKRLNITCMQWLKNGLITYRSLKRDDESLYKKVDYMNIVNTHVHCFILGAWHESCFPSSGIHSIYMWYEKNMICTIETDLWPFITNTFPLLSFSCLLMLLGLTSQ